MRRIAVVALLSTLAMGGLALSQRPDVRDDRVVHETPTTIDSPTTTEPPSTTTDTEPPPTPNFEGLLRDYSAWTRVAVCEEGGWVGASGSAYPDSLGISAANWYRFGGGADISPIAQILVADRLIASYGVRVPDQEGCRGSW